MERSAQELARGILDRIPEELQERQDLERRFDKILAERMINDLTCVAPEVLQQVNCLRIMKICEAVLGDLSAPEWKQKVRQYIETGT